MRPALAFVIPAYNAEATVGETIRSVLAQTEPDVAALVVDDGSTDGTRAIAQRMAKADPRVRVVHQENRGLSGARNRGVSELLGAFYAGPVCFLDADDVVDPRFARLMIPALTDADAAACACRMAGPRLEDLGWVMRPGEHDFSRERVLEYNPVAVGSVVVRMESLARLGLLGSPFDEQLPVHEDWDLWLRFTARGGRWSIVQEALFSYRLQRGSMSSNLERMHRVGLDVISRADAEEAMKAGARRRWTIRHVARAAARGDAGLTREFLSQVHLPLTEADLELLTSSLRWSLCQQHQTGPSRVSVEQQREWLGLVRPALASAPGHEAVLRRLAFGEDRWVRAARAFLNQIERGATGVIYGVGRNGRELIAAIEVLLSEDLALAEAAGAQRGRIPRLAWVDDSEATEAPVVLGRPLPRLRMDALTPKHVVLVTPDQCSAIVRRLRALGLPRIETPDSIVLGETIQA